MDDFLRSINSPINQELIESESELDCGSQREKVYYTTATPAFNSIALLRRTVVERACFSRARSLSEAHLYLKGGEHKGRKNGPAARH